MVTRTWRSEVSASQNSTQDKCMHEGRLMISTGNLMLAVQARTFSNYFYLQSNNTNQPARFIENKVTGILFENKVDHTSTCNLSSLLIIRFLPSPSQCYRHTADPHPAYFGTTYPLIHGIHMMPLSPVSPYLRSKPFVREEWDRFFTPVPGPGMAVALSPVNKVCCPPLFHLKFFHKTAYGRSS